MSHLLPINTGPKSKKQQVNLISKLTALSGMPVIYLSLAFRPVSTVNFFSAVGGPHKESVLPSQDVTMLAPIFFTWVGRNKVDKGGAGSISILPLGYAPMGLGSIHSPYTVFAFGYKFALASAGFLRVLWFPSCIKIWTSLINLFPCIS